MTKKPLISIILSVFNGQDTISKSIESILSQSFNDFELLILDDSSSDNTFEIISNYDKFHENVHTFQNQKNIGLTKSLNSLILKSSSKFIGRQDADDISDKNRFEKQLFFIDKKNLDGCTTRSRIIGSKKIIPGLSYYLPTRFVIDYKNPFIHGSLLIKREIIEAINFYDERFYFSQDYKLMKDLLKNKYKVKILNEVLYNSNMQNNLSSRYKREQKYYADCVRKDLDPNAK